MPVKTSLSGKMEETIAKLKRKGYIRDSESKWNNMIRPVPKPNGSVRLCMNMMALNDITKDESQEIPNMDGIFDSLQGAEWLTVLDLKDEYFQILVNEEHKHKTAFTINGKRYEWNRMPMGFKNAPMIFQRIMNRELKKWINMNCNVYLDDIVVYGRTGEEHDRVLREILTKFRNIGLKINMDKIQLRKKEIKLLGMIVNGKGIRIPEEKQEEILNFNIPKTKKDIQRFLGAVNYHRRFINNITEKTAILSDILKDDRTMYDWTEEHTAKWRELQGEINKKVRRYHPDYAKEFILETDASDTGVGAILYQLNERNAREIIKPISAKPKNNEINWGITEKEVYAMVWAMEKLEQYLIEKKFRLITDHKADTWLKTKEDFGNPRIARWIERIQHFNFTIEYRDGDEMYEADALLRKYGTVD
ncbi:hypothetical protein PAEPH01_2586, partial [Pancytospora epiphaga]